MGELKVQYADIVYDTIVDGEGLRNTLYVSGCHNACPGCHNPKLQDPNYGKSESVFDIVHKLLKNDNVNDLTLSGGDPMEQASALTQLCFIWKLVRPSGNIWVYSGYTYEEIIANEEMKKLLTFCDVLVDGRFEIDKFDKNLLFRGSSNQRIIDVNRTRKEGKVVLYEPER